MPDTVSSDLREAVRSYVMPPEAIRLLTAHKPLLVAGATASGKDSVAVYLLEHGHYASVITHTARAPRDQEQNGQSYWFVTGEQMLKLLRAKMMIEAKLIHNHAIYGVSIKAYENAVETGKTPLLIVDVQGAEDIAKHIPDLQAVFLLPPSYEVWMERLDRRGHMSHIEKVKRLASARAEMEHALKSRYFNLFVNRDVNTTARAIIQNVNNPQEQHRNRELAQQLIDHIRHY